MMATMLGLRRDRPAGLQHSFDPLVTQRDAVVRAQLVAKMRHVEALVLILVQAQDLLHRGQGHFARTGSAATTVEQPVVALLLVTLFPAAHAAAGDAENLGSLPPL